MIPSCLLKVGITFGSLGDVVSKDDRPLFVRGNRLLETIPAAGGVLVKLSALGPSSVADL